MGTQTRTSSSGQAEDRTPLWARPFIRAAGVIAPTFLIIGSVLCLAMFILLILNKVDQPWIIPALSAMSFFLIAGYLTLLIAKYAGLVPGWFGVIFGTLLRVGIPFLMPFILQHNGMTKSVQNVRTPLDTLTPAAPLPTDIVAKFLQQFPDRLVELGVVLAILGVLHLIFVYVMRQLQSRGRARYHTMTYLDSAAADAMKVDYIPRCWQMSRCRPTARVLCPNYHDRVPCWRRRAGCFCHKELAAYLNNGIEQRNASTNVAALADTERQALSRIRDLIKRLKLPWNAQRHRCHTCPIFVEHQEYKFRNLHWVCLPITGLLIIPLYYPVHFGYQLLTNSMDAILRQVTTMTGYELGSPQLNSGFEYVILGVFVLLALSFVINFTEYLLLKLKV